MSELSVIPDAPSASEATVWRAREADASAEIAKILSEVSPPVVEEIVNATSVPAAPAPSTEKPPVPAEPGPDAVVADAPAPAAADVSDRGLLRLLEREGQIRDRESAIERREREVGTRVTELEAQLKAARDGAMPDDLEGAIAADPVGFFKSRGVAPEQVSRLILAHMLGDKAPPEIRESIREHRYDRRIRELEARIAQRDQDTEVSRIRGEAGTYASKADSVKYPVLSAIAAKDQKRATEAIFNKIAEDARTRNLRQGDPVMSYEDAAKAVEADWSVFRDALVPATSTNAVPAATNAPQTGKTAVTTSPPATKPVAPPPPRRNYWDPSDRDAEVMAALAEATAIAKRVGTVG